MGAGKSRVTDYLIIGSDSSGGAEAGISITFDDDFNNDIFKSPSGFKVSEKDVRALVEELGIGIGYPKDYKDYINSMPYSPFKPKLARETSLKTTLDSEISYNITASMVALNIISKEYTKLTGNKIIDNAILGVSDGNTLGRYSRRTIGGSDTYYRFVTLFTKVIKDNRNEEVGSGSGWSVGSDWGSSTMMHELGHAVMHNLDASPKTSNLVQNLFSKSTENKWHSVSIYGSKNHSESFAEAFSLYVRGRNTPNNAGKGDAYYNEFKSVMKEAGLSSMFGLAKYNTVYSQARKLGTSTPKVKDKGTVQPPKIAPKIAPPKTNAPKVLTAPKSMPISTSKVGTAQFTGKTMSVNLGGTSISVEITSAMQRRGFINKFANGKQYRIDTLTGAVTLI